MITRHNQISWQIDINPQPLLLMIQNIFSFRLVFVTDKGARGENESIDTILKSSHGFELKIGEP